MATRVQTPTNRSQVEKSKNKGVEGVAKTNEGIIKFNVRNYERWGSWAIQGTIRNNIITVRDSRTTDSPYGNYSRVYAYDLNKSILSIGDYYESKVATHYLPNHPQYKSKKEGMIRALQYGLSMNSGYKPSDKFENKQKSDNDKAIKVILEKLK